MTSAPSEVSSVAAAAAIDLADDPILEHLEDEVEVLPELASEVGIGRRLPGGNGLGLHGVSRCVGRARGSLWARRRGGVRWWRRHRRLRCAPAELVGEAGAVPAGS